MLTISTIKNTNAAKYYAKEDNYYLSEVDAKEASLWWGAGAVELDLQGKVKENELQDLLAGKLPNGVTVGLKKDGTINHRPGYDLCFQAPKSVSILALDGEDKRFYNAHLDAVRETLKVIERDCAQAKVFKNRRIRFENTKNLTVALVRHTASRELDPHLHHHALVINATKRSDSAWRALASSKIRSDEVNGFFERIHHNQIYYGLIYKTALAQKVRKLDCELEIVGKHGLWEIKGVPKEARELMSKRRLQIEERIDKLPYASLKAADVVALDTREKKPKNIDLTKIKQIWRDELASVGFSSKEFIANLDKTKNHKLEAIESKKNNIIASEATRNVENAIEHLSQYKLKLDYEKIVAQALEFSIAENVGGNHAEIIAALEDFIKDGKLIPLDKSGSKFVTKEIIETEKAIMDMVGRGKEASSKIALKDTILNSIENGEAKDLAIEVLKSKSRLSLVESKTNKSNNIDNTEFIKFVDAAFRLAEFAGKTVRILSPNRMMANDINENIRRRPNSLWQWLVSLGKPEVGESIAGFKHKYREEVDLPLLRFRQGKDVIIVNNAETLGSNDMYSLLELTEKSKAKVIFLRDVKARQGFSTGNPVETLKQASIELFKLDSSKNNEKNEANKKINYIPELKSIENDNERTKQLAALYATGKAKEDYEHNNTLVIVGSKKQLEATNCAIRQELKKLGKLSNVEQTISVLNPVYLSKAESTIAHRYPKNAVIRFYNKSGRNRGNDDWNIESINKENNTIRLIQNGRRMLFDPRKHEANYAVFTGETLQVAVCDKLVATTNMKNLGIKNATKFVVQDLTEKYIRLLSASKELKETKKPEELKIKLSDLKDCHFQHDYATTLSRYSKKQVDHVIVDMKAYALDKAAMDELTSCAKESLTIFTDDADSAQKRFFKHVPVKLTAAEVLLNRVTNVHNTNNELNALDTRETSVFNQLVTNQLVETNETKKTIEEIKRDIDKSATTLGTRYELAQQIERKAVDFAIETLASRNAGFTHEDLVEKALTYVLNESSSNEEMAINNDIEEIIAEKQASGDLIKGKLANSTIWTTKEAVKLEKFIIESIKQGSDKLTPLMINSETANDLIKNVEKNEKNNSYSIAHLTQDQKNGCHLITTTKDQYVIVQGYAGTGKTTMFAKIQDMLREQKEKENKAGDANEVDKEVDKGKDNKISISIDMLALAPTHRAVKELKSIGIEAQTLKSFLVKQGKDIDSSLDYKLIILDEASMVSNQDFARFLQIVGKSKAHVVFSGDIAQHISIESGKPFEIIQRSNILKTVYLREIVRQKNLNLKDIVESVIHKDYQSAFDGIEREDPQKYIERSLGSTSIKPDSQKELPKEGRSPLSPDFFNTLKKSMVEVDNRKLKEGGKLLEQMVAEDFLSRTPETRDQTIVIAHANQDRRVINKFIRDGLKEHGEISKDCITVNCLRSKNLTDAEHKALSSYSIDDVVKIGKDYYRVVERDELSKSLSLRDESGKSKYFYPEKHLGKYIELYEYSEEELAVGDVIRLTKSDKERELYANFRYRVNGISNGKIVLESKNEKSEIVEKDQQNKQKSVVILNPKDLRDAHWDYAQTVTGYGIQGGSKAYVIDFEVSNRKHLANQRSFYIGTSRAVKHLALYTDSKVRLFSCVSENKGDKYAALEVTGDINTIDVDHNHTRTNDNNRHHIDYPDFFDVKEINKLLNNSAESMVERLLGKPNMKLSSATEWRYGRKGSLVINMSSDKKGLWYNFETGESGNLLTLIQKETGLACKESLKYVSDIVGKELSVDLKLRSHMRITRDSLPDNKALSGKKETEREAKVNEYVQKLVAASRPIVGTVVEEYLKKIRGINSIDNLDVRYHPKVYVGRDKSPKYLPAMLAIGRDKDGNIQCVQATYIDPKTKNKAELDVKKRTYASVSGALVSLQKESQTLENHESRQDRTNKDEISFIAEGVETGLSVKDAVGEMKNSKVLVTLGKSNFANIEPRSIGQKVILCLDNDGESTFTDKIIHRAAERLMSFGKEVFIAIPDQISIDTMGIGTKTTKTTKTAKTIKKIKTDFNDIAKMSDIDAVRKSLDNAVSYQDWKKNIEENKQHQINKTIPNIADKIIRRNKEYCENNKVYSSLFKTPEINLNAATKLIYSELEGSLIKHIENAKYIDTYNQVQKDLAPKDLSIQNGQNIQRCQKEQKEQKSIDISKGLDIGNKQKFLSKGELEIC